MVAILQERKWCYYYCEGSALAGSSQLRASTLCVLCLKPGSPFIVARGAFAIASGEASSFILFLAIMRLVHRISRLYRPLSWHGSMMDSILVPPSCLGRKRRYPYLPFHISLRFIIVPWRFSSGALRSSRAPSTVLACMWMHLEACLLILFYYYYYYYYFF